MRLISLSLLTTYTSGFYLPGVDPLSFLKDDQVEMKVNAMSSVHTQIPRDYYGVKYCQPEGGPTSASENLGEFMTGNKIQSSPYMLQMKKDKFCNILCQSELNKEDAEGFYNVIKHEYNNHWIIDNLPSASLIISQNVMYTNYAGGFPVGFVDGDKKAYIFNHVKLIVEYHQVVPEEEAYRVVGFLVEPISVKHKFSNGFDWDGKSADGLTKPLDSCSGLEMLNADDITDLQVIAEGEKIVFTYDVVWAESETRWASRWDIYLSMDGAVSSTIHWFSIVNSLLIILFLTTMIGMVLFKNLRRDINEYNRNLTDEEKAEEREDSGWKLVHADVFRPPTQHPMLFCVFVGAGTQFVMMTCVTMVFACLGFLSPARRGSMVMMLLVMYVIFGATAGYTSSRLFKSFRGRSWQRCTVLTATLFPGTGFCLYLMFNCFLSAYHSTGAVPFLQLLSIMALWCCVSIPLVFFGAFFGYKYDTLSYPTVTSSIPREIPEQPWYFATSTLCLLGGILPFGAAFVELFFIMSSIWMDQYYYVFGFAFLVFLILVVTCAELSMLLCYFHLCSEDYNWWWRSFLTSGSTAFYVFGYSCFWFQKLEPSSLVLTYLLFFGYMFMVSVIIFLVTGTTGFVSCLWFTRRIFGSIKVD
ncbi:hypothetical protein ScalyP_jg5906 [Parmales sp. scaly parma]|nr:hypothetical protein ScalyP_jg5906 [Parmales sp. scaly parma]